MLSFQATYSLSRNVSHSALHNERLPKLIHIFNLVSDFNNVFNAFFQLNVGIFVDGGATFAGPVYLRSLRAILTRQSENRHKNKDVQRRCLGDLLFRMI